MLRCIILLVSDTIVYYSSWIGFSWPSRELNMSTKQCSFMPMALTIEEYLEKSFLFALNELTVVKLTGFPSRSYNAY